MTGARGGVRVAYEKIREKGGRERMSYLQACARGAEYAFAARVFRKHGVRVGDAGRRWVLQQATVYDRLTVPASRLWRGDLEYVRFPSSFGAWKREGRGLIVPVGGYFDARNPGGGRSPVVTWNLRTGGRVSGYGRVKPVPAPLP